MELQPVKLHYAELPLGSEIKEIEFPLYFGLERRLIEILKDKKDDRVYLYSYGGLENPIIISCNPAHIRMAIRSGFSEHHLHEYETYEDAYKVATDMMEEHELCYQNTRIEKDAEGGQPDDN